MMWAPIVSMAKKQTSRGAALTMLRRLRHKHSLTVPLIEVDIHDPSFLSFEKVMWCPAAIVRVD